MIYDIVIIGAGIIGSSIAYRLSKYDARLLVVDREADPADEITLANSAIVHAGQDPADGTLKAKLNVRGAQLYPALCRKLKVRYSKVGAYTVMVAPEQEAAFLDLARKAEERRVRYAILSREEARREEPHLSDNTIKVLSMPDTAVILPWEVAIAELQVALANGAEVRLNTSVTSIEKKDHYILHTSGGAIEARYVINAAGLDADHLADSFVPNGITVTPKRGEYFVLSHNARDFVHHVIYPIPTAKGKGILAVPTVDHNILLGPNSQEITDRQGLETTAEGLAYVRQEICSTLKDVPFSEVIRTFAGLRPSVPGKDFIIEPAEGDGHLLNLIGIDSPGIASAPAIAEYAEDLLRLPYPVRDHWVDSRPEQLEFSRLSPQEKNAYIQAHPAYGKIVCRCEQVSEGEIVAAISQPLGARSIKGVKKRVRPGMGKCQGGFCEPLVLKILARELKIDPTEVLYDQPGSNILNDRKGGAAK